MLRLGLLGGMSWESSIEYERQINQRVRERLGGTASADLVIRSFNFAEIEDLQAKGDWETAGKLLAEAAVGLQSLGAEGLVLCTNTMHKLAEVIEAAVQIPLLHIADATAIQIQSQGLRKVALLGTKFTMEQDFYKDRLVEKFGLEVLIPSQPQRNEIHRVIYEELVQGQVLASSKEFYLEVIQELVSGGAEGVIAGCTEIELLVTPSDVGVPYFPTTAIHAAAAADFALET
jgi:aspartate racemase